MIVRIAATVADGPRRGESLSALVATVQRLNESYLRAHPEVPMLMQAGVRFAREPIEIREEFATVPIVYARGWGDCDDLAPWFAAEYVVRRGIAARAVVRQVRPRLWHCQVRLPGGRIVDPSAMLGMRGEG